ncbi:MAG TPA: sodium:proline symporter, partial [Treponemataceae bacterium]|nr:sodium:proline symporter [Treponemataceae bacterium]
RLGVVGFAVIAFIIAANDSDNILAMVGYAWGGFGAAFGPVVLLSVLWRKVTKWGALSGIVVGSLTIFLVKNYIQIPGEYVYELLPGFVIAFIAVVVVSLFTKQPSEEVLQHFDEAKKAVK